MPKSDSAYTTDPSAPTTSEMDALWADHRAREILDRTLRLAPLGSEGLELALDIIASELRIAHRQGEIAGEMDGERRLLQLHGRMAA